MDRRTILWPAGRSDQRIPKSTDRIWCSPWRIHNALTGAAQEPSRRANRVGPGGRLEPMSRYRLRQHSETEAAPTGSRPGRQRKPGGPRGSHRERAERAGRGHHDRLHLRADVHRPRADLRHHADRQLRPGRVADAGHVRQPLSGDRRRRAGLPRALYRPVRRRAAGRTDRVRRRRAAAQVPDRPGVRPAHRRLARRGPFRPVDRHAGHFADPAERRPDPVRLHAA